MGDENSIKKSKSFSLKVENAKKIEKIAFEEDKKQSEVVDNMAEDFEYGNK